MGHLRKTDRPEILRLFRVIPSVAPTAPPRFFSFRHLRPEWCVVGVFIAATALGVASGDASIGPINVEVHYQLASAFCAGWIAALAGVFGTLLLRSFPSPARHRWIGGWLAFTTLAALALFLTVRPPQAIPITRLLEASALCVNVTTALLTLFLTVAGLVPLRAAWTAALSVGLLWGPLVTFLAGSGVWMLIIIARSPQVWDPVLLRMDLSLGFSPSEAIFAWGYGLRWVELVSTYGYPLLGAFIAAVAARLHLTGATAHARRFLAATYYAGVLGLVCYALVPAIGPINAFPSFFASLPMTPAQLELATATRDLALHGPERIAGGAVIARNVMPSLHVAFTLITLAAAWSWRRKFFWCCLPVGIVQIATTLTICVHYVVDLFAAVPFAALCWWLADRGVRATQHVGDKPLPALALGGEALVAGNRALWVALAAATVALVVWGCLAPLPPGVAWALSGLVVGAPAWASLRVNRQVFCCDVATSASNSTPRTTVN